MWIIVVELDQDKHFWDSWLHDPEPSDVNNLIRILARDKNNKNIAIIFDDDNKDLDKVLGGL
jgi:hypothetical protein